MAPRGGQGRKTDERQPPDHDQGQQLHPGTGQIKRHFLLLFRLAGISWAAASTGEKLTYREPNLKSPFSQHSCSLLPEELGLSPITPGANWSS
jgi:hypothetical protein